MSKPSTYIDTHQVFTSTLAAKAFNVLVWLAIVVAFALLGAGLVISTHANACTVTSAAQR